MRLTSQGDLCQARGRCPLVSPPVMNCVTSEKPPLVRSLTHLINPPTDQFGEGVDQFVRRCNQFRGRGLFLRRCRTDQLTVCIGAPTAVAIGSSIRANTGSKALNLKAP